MRGGACLPSQSKSEGEIRGSMSFFHIVFNFNCVPTTSSTNMNLWFIVQKAKVYILITKQQHQKHRHLPPQQSKTLLPFRVRHLSTIVTCIPICITALVTSQWHTMDTKCITMHLLHPHNIFGCYKLTKMPRTNWWDKQDVNSVGTGSAVKLTTE